jgi:hypothetical protein
MIVQSAHASGWQLENNSAEAMMRSPWSVAELKALVEGAGFAGVRVRIEVASLAIRPRASSCGARRRARRWRGS